MAQEFPNSPEMAPRTAEPKPHAKAFDNKNRLAAELLGDIKQTKGGKFIPLMIFSRNFQKMKAGF